MQVHNLPLIHNNISTFIQIQANHAFLPLKYVVSLNISIVSITTLNQYLAINSQQLPEIPKKGPEYPKMDSKARNSHNKKPEMA